MASSYFWLTMPSWGLAPALLMNSRATEMGTAKLKPCTSLPLLGSTVPKVAMPMTRPWSSKTGPPLLPCVMGASTWSTGQPPEAVFLALTVPLVSVGSTWLASDRTGWNVAARSEEHTSELQSRPHLVCRLLLEKKKQQPKLQSRPELQGGHPVESQWI